MALLGLPHRSARTRGVPWLSPGAGSVVPTEDVPLGSAVLKSAEPWVFRLFRLGVLLERDACREGKADVFVDVHARDCIRNLC